MDTSVIIFCVVMGAIALGFSYFMGHYGGYMSAYDERREKEKFELSVRKIVLDELKQVMPGKRK